MKVPVVRFKRFQFSERQWRATKGFQVPLLLNLNYELKCDVNW